MHTSGVKSSTRLQLRGLQATSPRLPTDTAANGMHMPVWPAQLSPKCAASRSALARSPASTTPIHTAPAL